GAGEIEALVPMTEAPAPERADVRMRRMCGPERASVLVQHDLRMGWILVRVPIGGEEREDVVVSLLVHHRRRIDGSAARDTIGAIGVGHPEAAEAASIGAG